MKEIHIDNGHPDFSKEDAPYGWIFLGRDTKSWGEEGTGSVTIDPDKECENGCPYYNHPDYDAINDPIHLNIAAFRDRLCPRTLYNLFRKAKNPHRIYVRLVQQREFESDLDDDADCWKRFCDEHPDQPCDNYRHQVQVLTMNAKSAKGPTDPRSKLSTMVQYDYLHQDKPMLRAVDPNDYCMQTDSHMDFNVDFDVGIIEMFHRAKNDYAVLSTYVADISQTDTNPSNVPHLCMVEMSNSWRNWGTKFCEHLKRPKMTNVAWGAGLSFQKCHAELNVPYDPYLPGVFNGEELSRGFRFFTFGYDMYTPDEVLVTHDYHGHQSNPNVHTWGGEHSKANSDSNPGDDMSQFMKEIDEVFPSVEPKSTKRLNVLMGIDKAKHEVAEMIANSRYGFGDRRTLEQAVEFSGFDPVKKRMTKNTCGNLAWVPFDEDDNFGLDRTLARPLWNDREEKLMSHDEFKEMKHHVVAGRLQSLSNAEAAVREDKSMILVLLIGFLLSGFVIYVARRRLYVACQAKKSARLVV